MSVKFATATIQLKRSQLIYLIVILLNVIGLVGLSLPICHKIFIHLSSLNILLSVALVIFYHTTSHTLMQRAEERRLLGQSPTDYIAQQGMTFVLKSFLVGVAGFILEADALKTSAIFGEYTYGNALGPKLMGVPIILGLHWFFIVYCSTYIAGLLKLPMVATALISGLIITGFDLILEPNAIVMGYWNWQNGDIPVQNYIARFIAGSVFSLFYIYRSAPVHNTMAVFLFVVQVIFYSCLYFVRLFIAPQGCFTP